MKTSLIKKSICSVTLLLSMQSQAGVFSNLLENVMATINPNAGINGPIYRQKTKDKDGYGNELTTILLEEAHRQGKRFLNEGNTQAYYAFIALALTVPNQEGLLIHFREVKAKDNYCRDKRSLGDGISSNKAKKHFKMALNDRGLARDPNNGFLVPCSKLTGERVYRQLIVGGSDGSDVGIMQLSALWHYEEFLKEVKYASVRSTVRYGLSYIMRRYRKAFRDYEALGCFSKSTGEIDYKKIVRGSWSAYNGGPSQLCRFSDPESAHKGKDKGFNENLTKTLALNNGGIFGFNKEGEIKLTGTVKSAVDEAISNFENKTNNRTYLKSILGE